MQKDVSLNETDSQLKQNSSSVNLIYVTSTWISLI